MKEIRIILMVLFTLVASRMFGELPVCFGKLFEDCGYGLIVIIPFLLSTYFIDSLIAVLSESEDNKKKIINSIFCSPYIIFAGFVVVNFISSVTIVSVEYMLSIETLYTAIIYTIFYLINNIKTVRNLNTIFMVSFLFTILIFYFI